MTLGPYSAVASYYYASLLRKLCREVNADTQPKLLHFADETAFSFAWTPTKIWARIGEEARLKLMRPAKGGVSVFFALRADGSVAYVHGNLQLTGHSRYMQIADVRAAAVLVQR